VLLASRPSGVPAPEHFALVRTPIPQLGNGQILVRNHLLSVDPAQRGWANNEGNYSDPVSLGTPMRALAVGEVVESSTPHYCKGEFVYGWFGWQTYCVTDPDAVLRRVTQSALPLSANLSLLGINGLTAYLALHQLGRPVAGETILVSTAAGSVGSFVGQLARILGCTPVGLTGTAEKVRIAQQRYGYSTAINYRQETAIAQALQHACPQGYDVFFDNTGGPIADAAIRSMRRHGRIIQCGTASIASWAKPVSGVRNEREILTRRLQWSGFIIFDHIREFAAAAEKLTELALSNKIVFDEEILFGLDQAPTALSRLYRGQNIGKLIVQLV
jgi:NADPH-dependent curcumin reductase CurA